MRRPMEITSVGLGTVAWAGEGAQTRRDGGGTGDLLWHLVPWEWGAGDGG